MHKWCISPAYSFFSQYMIATPGWPKLVGTHLLLQKWWMFVQIVVDIISCLASRVGTDIINWFNANAGSVAPSCQSPFNLLDELPTSAVSSYHETNIPTAAEVESVSNTWNPWSLGVYCHRFLFCYLYILWGTCNTGSANESDIKNNMDRQGNSV